MLVVVLMGIMVAGAAWYTSPRQETTQVAVMLPADIYKLLALKGETEVDASGRPRSVVQVIEAFARK
jgi:hypothetical protein